MAQWITKWVRSIYAWGLPFALLAATLMSYGDRFAGVEGVNWLAYDPLVAAISRFQLSPAQVLLIYATDTISRDERQCQDLVAKLEELGAKQIGVVNVGVAWTDDQRRAVAGNHSVVWGIGSEQRAQWPSDLPAGDVALWHSADGVYRWHRVGDDSSWQSLEAELVARAYPDRPRPTNRVLGIRFRGGAESLPHVEASAVLASEITASLVRDRIVLIGTPTTAFAPGVATPTARDERMSLLELHGQITNCIATNGEIQPISRTSRSILYLLAAQATILLARRSRLHRVVVGLLAIWILQAMLVAMTLWLIATWLPVASFMIVELCALGWVVHHRLQFSEDAWHIMRRRGFQLSPRYKQHPVLEAGTQPWPRISAFLQQMFPLDRVAVLIAEDGKERLDLVASVGFEDADLVERRRDIRRQPFSDAVERRTTLRIDDTRPFFHPVLEQYQFLAPLLHAGTVKGAIVVQLSRSAVDRLPGFTHQFTLLCDEVATWVARYQEIAAQAQRQNRWWRRWQVSLEQTTFETLQSYLHSLERRLYQTHQVVEQATIGKSVFDLCGNVITMNATMFRLLHKHGLGSQDLTVLQMLRTLCQRDVHQCRELVRRVLIEGREERCLIREPDSTASQLLVVRPLNASEWLAARTDEMRAFQTHGVHVELIQEDLFSDIHQVREHATEQAMDEVDTILRDVRSLSEEIRAEKAHRAWSDLRSHVSKARWTIQHCQSLLDNGQSDSNDDVWPVDIGLLVRRVASDMQGMTERHGATISTSVPNDLPDVRANPLQLRQAMGRVIEVLLQHARDRSLLNVQAKAVTDGVLVSFQNEGCGVILENVRKGRHDWCDPAPVSLMRLEETRNWLLAWGGELIMESNFGEGSMVQIHLRHFTWISEPTQGPSTSTSAR